jgi:hypothetical protein
VQQDRVFLGLQKLERLDEERDVMAIDRAVITQAELLKDYARQNEVFDALLHFVRELDRRVPADHLDEIARLVVQVTVSGAGRDIVQVGGNRADVFRDRPFVVIQNDDKALRL